MTGPETYIISIITRSAGHFAKSTSKGVSARVWALNPEEASLLNGIGISRYTTAKSPV